MTISIHMWASMPRPDHDMAELFKGFLDGDGHSASVLQQAVSSTTMVRR